MQYRNVGTGGRALVLGWRGWLVCLMALGWSPSASWAMPLSSQARARLSAGQATLVIVEVDAAATDRIATGERAARRLRHDNAAILAMRSQGYAATKGSIESGVTGADAVRVHDYEHLPLAVWRISSTAALSRLEAYPGVRAVHQDVALHAVSVSDLPFIHQPQAAAEGATGEGTTIAVIDGGLVSNFTTFQDFGLCAGVGVPAACRVVFNKDYYSGAQASAETTHGTNVSAIALGVAPGASLAMFDVFQGASASSSDIIDALNIAISKQATYNIVAVNLSLGDGTANSAQCPGSPFAAAFTATLNAGIQPVVAAGNSGVKTGVADPACVPGAVSVGAVYDAGYGTVTWGAPGVSGGQCTDASAVDHVTCFSQSASYLSILAPGTFVNAPTASFQQSGTSQATPHISGSIAVLRARYPHETFAELLRRLQVSGVTDTDTANGRATPRLNLQAAVDQGTSVSVSGSGPTTSVAGQVGTYTITITNNGPLDATGVSLADALPAGSTLKSASSGCGLVGSTVVCSVGTLAAGGTITLTIAVNWTASGAAYDAATVKIDQSNSSTHGTVQFGTPPAPVTLTADAPLPIWAYVVLGAVLIGFASRRLRPIANTP